MRKSSNKNVNEFLLVISLTVIIQYIITFCYTNAKHFSGTAMVRNVTFSLGIYFYLKTKNVIYIFIPFIIELLIQFAKYKGYQIEKYIATEYKYSDYWRDIVASNKLFSNFSEGIYDNVFGFDTKDHSVASTKKILDWSVDVYNNAFQTKQSGVKGLDGKNNTNSEKLKTDSDIAKFKTISEICKVDKNMRVLEIGFGEGDFMKYLLDNYGIKPVGVSISGEQVNVVRAMGFEAHKMNMWDINPELLGSFDLILQCGNCEYIRCNNESEDKYTEYFNIVKKLLKPGGKYFITCIHGRKDFTYNFSLYDNIRCYFLWMGNDGSYPSDKFALTKHAENAKLNVVHQEERTNEYWIASVLFFSSFQFNSNQNFIFTASGLANALVKTIAAPYFIHTYLCYSPTSDYYWLPWLWEFVPREVNGKFESPVSLEYILFESK
jgi:cyclopropane fatty-acyl-phospholipid synthase-like methyltransferase